MTNYNEKVDELLANLCCSLHVLEVSDCPTCHPKQALTSLIKELIEEAKPEVPEEYERDDALSIGFTRGTEYYYDAISNLLKALEEL